MRRPIWIAVIVAVLATVGLYVNSIFLHGLPAPAMIHLCGFSPYEDVLIVAAGRAERSTHLEATNHAGIVTFFKPTCGKWNVFTTPEAKRDRRFPNGITIMPWSMVFNCSSRGR